MYRGLKVSVVMPAHNEAEGIEASVRKFLRLPEVDEVVVADNNSTDGTATLAALAGARVEPESQQGYGFASRRALQSAIGDLVIITESDGTFRANDVYKFLSYAGEFDVVFGTRTSKSCIWEGSNMGPFLRYGNWAVAKLLEYLHNGPCLTDVGCTYKLLTRPALGHLAPLFTVGSSHFSPELMILAIRSRLSCVEVPVHYQPRVGTSKITGNRWKAIRLGLRMIAMTIRYRFKEIPKAPVNSETGDGLSRPRLMDENNVGVR
jgi:glycosyltransferase involved in cell wall biosynthesis